MTTPSFEHYHTIIIGASISGSVAAYLLGKQGKTVLVIDAQPFPRRKVCGEGLSLLGQRQLDALGLWSKELQQNAVPFYGYDIHLQNQKQILLSKENALQGYGISRRVLDVALQNAALTMPSVSLLQDRAKNIAYDKEQWSISTLRGLTYSSPHLLLACGVDAARKLAPKIRRTESSLPRYGMAFWCKGKWEESLPTTIHIYQQPEGQYLITPLTTDSINISVLLSKTSSPSSRQAIEKKGRAFAEQAGFTLTELVETRGSGAIHSSRVYMEKDLPMYLVGDAAERMDPIGGMGMTHGIYSAFLAAQSIASETRPTKRKLIDYYRKRKQGANILRMLSSLSYQLNVSNTAWIQRLSLAAPKISLQTVSLLKTFFPQIKASSL